MYRLPLLLLSLACAACSTSQAFVEINGHRFHVEVADTEERQALGLMFRREMPADRGMLFIFKREAPRSFWMRNTYIPLDILYFDAQQKLVSKIENAQPCKTTRCPSYPSTAPAQYVLEINAGLSAQLQLELGDNLSIQLPGR